MLEATRSGIGKPLEPQRMIARRAVSNTSSEALSVPDSGVFNLIVLIRGFPSSKRVNATMTDVFKERGVNELMFQHAFIFGAMSSAVIFDCSYC